MITSSLTKSNSPPRLRTVISDQTVNYNEAICCNKRLSKGERNAKFGAYISQMFHTYVDMVIRSGSVTPAAGSSASLARHGQLKERPRPIKDNLANNTKNPAMDAMRHSRGTVLGLEIKRVRCCSSKHHTAYLAVNHLPWSWVMIRALFLLRNLRSSGNFILKKKIIPFFLPTLKNLSNP